MFRTNRCKTCLKKKSVQVRPIYPVDRFRDPIRFKCECRNCGNLSSTRDSELDAVDQWNEENPSFETLVLRIRWLENKVEQLLEDAKGGGN